MGNLWKAIVISILASLCMSLSLTCQMQSSAESTEVRVTVNEQSCATLLGDYEFSIVINGTSLPAVLPAGTSFLVPKGEYLVTPKILGLVRIASGPCKPPIQRITSIDSKTKRSKGD